MMPFHAGFKQDRSRIDASCKHLSKGKRMGGSQNRQWIGDSQAKIIDEIEGWIFSATRKKINIQGVNNEIIH